MSTKVKSSLAAIALCLAFLSMLWHFILVVQLAGVGQPYTHLIFRVGFSFLLVLWLGTLFARFLTSDPQTSVDRPFGTLVMLLREPKLVTEEGLRRAIESSLGIQMDGADSEATDFVAGQGSMYLIQLREHIFVVNNCSGPYHREGLKEAKCVPDPVLHQHLVDHCAWMSIDLISFPEGGSISSAYRLMGPIFAELTGSDCLALHCPAAGYWAPWQESDVEKLQSQDPLSALEFGEAQSPADMPVDIPAMLVAAEEARNRWMEFAKAFQTREVTYYSFYVKIRLSEGEEHEFPWLSVVKVEGESVTATIDTEPVSLSLKPGSTVTAPVSDVWDWMILPPGGAQPIGFFTELS